MGCFEWPEIIQSILAFFTLLIAIFAFSTFWKTRKQTEAIEKEFKLRTLPTVYISNVSDLGGISEYSEPNSDEKYFRISTRAEFINGGALTAIDMEFEGRWHIGDQIVDIPLEKLGALFTNQKIPYEISMTSTDESELNRALLGEEGAIILEINLRYKDTEHLRLYKVLHKYRLKPDSRRFLIEPGGSFTSESISTKEKGFLARIIGKNSI